MADIVAREVAACVLYHHERVDAEGYPFGVGLRTLPIAVRIVQVADAYDAMTSDRPYRRALSHEAALKEIQKHSGTQFDPAVATAFMQVFGNRDTAAAALKQLV